MTKIEEVIKRIEDDGFSVEIGRKNIMYFITQDSETIILDFTEFNEKTGLIFLVGQTPKWQFEVSGKKEQLAFTAVNDTNRDIIYNIDDAVGRWEFSLDASLYDEDIVVASFCYVLKVMSDLPVDYIVSFIKKGIETFAKTKGKLTAFAEKESTEITVDDALGIDKNNIYFDLRYLKKIMGIDELEEFAKKLKELGLNDND